MGKDRILNKLDAFMRCAENLRELSYDPKYKVSSIVFPADFTEISSIGYNGNYAGGPNERDSMESGESGFIHAELNALMKLKRKATDGDVIYCTWTPCWHCAKCIANSNIKRAVFKERYVKDNRFEEIFKQAGVDYVILTECNEEEILRVITND